MKEFQDFLDHIYGDDFQTIIQAANQSMITCNMQSQDAKSIFIALELLQRYYYWCNE